MGGVNSHHYLDDFLAQGAECCEVKSKVSERPQVRISGISISRIGIVLSMDDDRNLVVEEVRH